MKIGPWLYCMLFLYCGLVMPIENHQHSNSSKPAQPSPPRLTCHILTENGDEVPVTEKIKVSNLKRIRFRVKLSGSQLPLDPLSLNPVAENPVGTAQPTLEILVNLLSAGNRMAVPTKVIQTGRGIELEQTYLTGLLEIPIDEVKRKQNIDNYLKKLEQESKKAGREAEFRHLTQDREVAIATFEKLYVDNRVGEFELTCKYATKRPGFWQGVVESFPPIRIQVFFERNFFEQPNFR